VNAGSLPKTHFKVLTDLPVQLLVSLLVHVSARIMHVTIVWPAGLFL